MGYVSSFTLRISILILYPESEIFLVFGINLLTIFRDITTINESIPRTDFFHVCTSLSGDTGTSIITRMMGNARTTPLTTPLATSYKKGTKRTYKRSAIEFPVMEISGPFFMHIASACQSYPYNNI